MHHLECVTKVADTYIVEHKPESLNWNWGEALLMYSLSLLDDLLGDERYFHFYQSYVDCHYKKGIVVDQSDTCAPVLITNELYKKTADIKYLAMTQQGIHYLKYEPRLIGNLINHNGHSQDAKDYPKSIWVDSIMMSGVFSAIAAKDFKDENLLNFALTQPRDFANYLQDPKGKLFHHSYWKILRRPYPRNIFWARGNGWVVAGLSLFLNYVDDIYATRILNEVSYALLSYQRPDYYFDTVLNKPNDNYRESSATALIAAGWLNGVSRGYLGQEFATPAIKAFRAVLDNVRHQSDGSYMTEISRWTIPMFLMPYRLKYGPYPGYKYVKKGENISYGIAALIFAAIAYEEYINNRTHLSLSA
ncbi:glycoside hydrolase family 88 protein [Agarilytica rhodophyticola]|uniref:glycoside hydrolase family 88 protein n=1 Tax=Agarilytica rhodophyticola TaxID=1737490 RepID=UPI000B348A8E|nr:glycoside hydrolase family 88 protein [Agarilytica rhodophyticola]